MEHPAPEPCINDKKYDQNAYNRRFIEKNTEKIHTQHICDVCCGSYTYFNKSKHLKSKKHMDLLLKARPTPPCTS